MKTNLGVIVLAAGQGTRMKSALPKVLHPICGKPMAAHVLDAARELSPTVVAVVVGHGSGQVREALAAGDIAFVEQTELLGTADAVRRCREALASCDKVMVLNGDCPLITPGLLARLTAIADSAPVVLVTAMTDRAGRLGRVLRDAAGRVSLIAEAADYEGDDGPAEVNAGQYVFDAAWLWENLGAIPLSAKGEYYLTHLPAVAHDQGRPAVTFAAEAAEVMGVDDRVRLAEAERVMRSRILEAHMLAGVAVVDPATTYVDANVLIEPDVTLLPNCYLSGKTRVGTGAVIGPGSTLRDAIVGEDTTIQASFVEESAVGRRCHVGPFAHVRGGAVVGDECHLGNYAEVKNSNLGRGVKMHHFSYLGDADVGEYANIAAGIITCNYDGVEKHRTVIGAHAFVGSDTMLVAPVTVGDHAITGAGSVVTRDVPPGGKVAGVPARAIPRGRRGG